MKLSIRPPKECFFVGSARKDIRELPEDALYVLHVFQKKAKKGAETPRHDIELIKRRLQDAKEHYREHFGKERHKP